MNIPTFLKNQVLNRWQKQGFQLILMIAFLVWTPLLITETLSIQHSCHPMIQPINGLPSDCLIPPKPKPKPKSKPKTVRDDSKPDSDKDNGKVSPPPPPPPPPPPALKVAAGVGIAVGVTLAAITTAPFWLIGIIAGAAAAGTAVIADKVINHLS